MARRIGERVRTLDPVHAFTLGLFSRLDALEEVPMNELLEGIPFSGTVKDALLSRKGEMGKLLELLDDYEAGRVAHLNGSVLSMLNEDYLHAAAWTEKCLVQEAI
jgi:EAL and modified HD-GYP domain-containing signal transduction protein